MTVSPLFKLFSGKFLLILPSFTTNMTNYIYVLAVFKEVALAGSCSERSQALKMLLGEEIEQIK